MIKKYWGISELRPLFFRDPRRKARGETGLGHFCHVNILFKGVKYKVYRVRATLSRTEIMTATPRSSTFLGKESGLSPQILSTERLAAATGIPADKNASMKQRVAYIYYTPRTIMHNNNNNNI